MKNRIIGILLAMAMLAAMLPTIVFADGMTVKLDGKAQSIDRIDPTAIGDATLTVNGVDIEVDDGYALLGDEEQLRMFAAMSNNGLWFDARLTSDITLTEEWTPFRYGDNYGLDHIGYYSDDVYLKMLERALTFDGDGHTVSGFYIGENAPDSDYCGFFDEIYGATILDLTVEGSIELQNLDSAEYNIGGIAGYCALTVFENTVSRVDISGEDVQMLYVGGFVSYSNFSRFYDCSVESEMSALADGSGSITSFSGFASTAYFSDMYDCNVDVVMNDDAGSSMNMFGGFSVLFFGSEQEALSELHDCTIKLRITSTASKDNFYTDFAGLGIRVYNADIENCRVDIEVELNERSESISGGGFAASLEGCELRDIYVDGEFDVDSFEYYMNIGGFANAVYRTKLSNIGAYTDMRYDESELSESDLENITLCAGAVALYSGSALENIHLSMKANGKYIDMISYNPLPSVDYKANIFVKTSDRSYIKLSASDVADRAYTADEVADALNANVEDGGLFWDLSGPGGGVAPYDGFGRPAQNKRPTMPFILWHAITVEQSEGGMITPRGPLFVLPNATHKFEIIPDDGYRIVDVIVDGESLGAVEVVRVTADDSVNSITAVFEKMR